MKRIIIIFVVLTIIGLSWSVLAIINYVDTPKEITLEELIIELEEGLKEFEEDLPEPIEDTIKIIRRPNPEEGWPDILEIEYLN